MYVDHNMNHRCHLKWSVWTIAISHCTQRLQCDTDRCSLRAQCYEMVRKIGAFSSLGWSWKMYPLVIKHDKDNLSFVDIYGWFSLIFPLKPPAKDLSQLAIFDCPRVAVKDWVLNILLALSLSVLGCQDLQDFSLCEPWQRKIDSV